jgi:hypothetical protein
MDNQWTYKCALQAYISSREYKKERVPLNTYLNNRTDAITKELTTNLVEQVSYELSNNNSNICSIRELKRPIRTILTRIFNTLRIGVPNSDMHQVIHFLARNKDAQETRNRLTLCFDEGRSRINAEITLMLWLTPYLDSVYSRKRILFGWKACIAETPQQVILAIIVLLRPYLLIGTNFVDRMFKVQDSHKNSIRFKVNVHVLGLLSALPCTGSKTGFLATSVYSYRCLHTNISVLFLCIAAESLFIGWDPIFYSSFHNTIKDRSRSRLYTTLQLGYAVYPKFPEKVFVAEMLYQCTLFESGDSPYIPLDILKRVRDGSSTSLSHNRNLDSLRIFGIPITTKGDVIRNNHAIADMVAFSLQFIRTPLQENLMELSEVRPLTKKDKDPVVKRRRKRSKEALIGGKLVTRPKGAPFWDPSVW